MDTCLLMDTDEIKKAFGRRVKELRKQRGWTQKDLAARLSIRFSVLDKYESGIHVPPVDKLIELAEIFGTSVDYLLTGNELEETPLHSHRLLDRFRELQQLDTDDQEAVIKFLDAMIIRRKIQDAVASPIPKLAARG